MRIEFLKSIASIYGGFVPGMVVDINNESVAQSWCNAGIAKPSKSKTTAEARQTISPKAKVVKEKPVDIPKGMFWCPRHSTLHRFNSPTGMKCLKRLEAEAAKAAEEEAATEAAKAEAEAKAVEEAEEKARQEAEQTES